MVDMKNMIYEERILSLDNKFCKRMMFFVKAKATLQRLPILETFISEIIKQVLRFSVTDKINSRKRINAHTFLKGCLMRVYFDNYHIKSLCWLTLLPEQESRLIP